MSAWRDEALCVTRIAQGVVEPDSFFPETKGTRESHRAREVCRACPVIRECHGFATSNGAMGIWGGQYLAGHLGKWKART